MAEKNKKRGGRRAHLNDFHVNLAGDYVYTGAHYSYVDQGRSRDRVQRELLGLSVAVVLAVVAGGCSDAPAMLNCWYVILPYICEAAAAVSVIWAVLRLRKAEEPIREYIYKKSVQALPHRAMLCMIFAGLGFVTMVLYLAMNGSGGRVASVIAYLALKALVAGGAWLLWRYMLTLKSSPPATWIRLRRDPPISFVNSGLLPVFKKI